MESMQGHLQTQISCLLLFKAILKTIQVSKLTSKHDQVVDEQEKLLCKLVLEIEPSIWPEFATFWLYTGFMTSCSYTEILLYCLDIQ
jgi:hypothetical protein